MSIVYMFRETFRIGQAPSSVVARWARLAGLCLVGLIVVGQFELRELAAHDVELNKQIGAMIRDLNQIQPPAHPVSAGPVLPLIDTLPRVTTDLHTLAQSQGVSIVEVTVTPIASGGSHLQRIDLNARVKGGYPGTKAMLGEFLALHDNCALMNIAVRRSEQVVGQLEVEFFFSLFYRKP